MGNIYTGVSVGMGFILFCLLMAVILIIFKNLKKRMLPEKKCAAVIEFSNYQTEEKRIDQRVDITWHVSVETTDGTIKAETKDLSRSGAFVKCSKPLFPGEQFRLIIEIPDQDPVTLNSEVVWSNGNISEEEVVIRGMGIRFLKNLDKDLETLKSALKTYLASVNSTTLQLAMFI